MTLNEAVKQGISRVFDPQWAPKDAYLKLTLVKTPKGFAHGPWLHLYSASEQQVLDYPTPQTLMFSSVSWDEDGWEKYEGELHEDDNDT